MTLFRLSVAPLGVMYCLQAGSDIAWLWGWMAAAIISDAEGTFISWFSWGEETELGRLLDPVADKVFTNFVVVLSLVYVSFSLSVILLLVLMLLYDCRNTMVRWPEILAALKGEVVGRDGLPASRISKWKTGVLFVTVTLLVTDFSADLAQWMVWLSIVMISLSWFGRKK